MEASLNELNRDTVVMYRDITLLRQQVDLLSARLDEPKGLYLQPSLMPPSVVFLVTCTQPHLMGGLLWLPRALAWLVARQLPTCRCPKSPHYWPLLRPDRVIWRRGVCRLRRKGQDQRRYAPVLMHRANQVDASLRRFLKGRTQPSFRAR